MEPAYYSIIALSTGFCLDQLLGDPAFIPHPIVGFGRTIAFFEKHFNRGNQRLLKGALVSFVLVAGCFGITFWSLAIIPNPILKLVVESLIVFFCLSARTLRQEVQMVFEAVDRSMEEGRKQVARIVGRDTSALNPQQIRTAALETLAENLSDGVIAPLFWFAVLGVPGMLAYKMINTLDSMIGYKNERYLLFGQFAARLDDATNYIPARLTALLMLLVGGKLNKINFVLKYGKCHTSPNSGYPEAALAANLDCRFGGPNIYFGQKVEKPFIGQTEKELGIHDMRKAIHINQGSEWLMLLMILSLMIIQLYHNVN